MGCIQYNKIEAVRKKIKISRKAPFPGAPSPFNSNIIVRFEKHMHRSKYFCLKNVLQAMAVRFNIVMSEKSCSSLHLFVLKKYRFKYFTYF